MKLRPNEEYVLRKKTDKSLFSGGTFSPSDCVNKPDAYWFSGGYLLDRRDRWEGFFDAVEISDY